jgi:hypothetical protein
VAGGEGLDPHGRALETPQEAFERIEAAVEAGDTDLGALGFWRLLATVKVDQTLARRWADAAGRIDRRAFEARVRPRFPIGLGNAVLIAVTGAGLVAAWVALETSSGPVAGLALLLAGGIWSVGLHDLAHWLVGRIGGIRFSCYFVGGPFPPRPGLKTDYASYLSATPRARAWMHASGAVATKLAPFLALALWPATDAPAWAAWGLLGLGVLQIVTDVAFSVRSSDWKKVRRELRIARQQRSAA